MKVAVLLFGHLRDFEICADSLQTQILDKYDCDVFIHTWDMTDHSTKVWHEQRFVPQKVEGPTKDLVVSKYHPKRFIIEHQDVYRDAVDVQSLESPDFSFSSAGIHFMFYSMNRANQLRLNYEEETSTQYDVVFVTRPDVMFMRYLDIQRVFRHAEIIGLDTNQCRFFATRTLTSDYLNALYMAHANDLIFFGKPRVINEYIKSNLDHSPEFLHSHALSVTTIFTAKELSNGIIPVPITYHMGDEWSFSGSRIEDVTSKLLLPKWKKCIFYVGAILLWPVSRIQQKYSILNYFVYKEKVQ